MCLVERAGGWAEDRGRAALAEEERANRGLAAARPAGERRAPNWARSRWGNVFPFLLFCFFQSLFKIV